MSTQTPRDIFFHFLERKKDAPKVLAAPIYGTFFYAGWRNEEWIPPWLNDKVVEDLLACGRQAKVIPIVCLGWWDLNPFGWELEDLGGDKDHRCFGWVIRERSGTLRQVFEDRPRLGASTLEYPIQTIDDYQVAMETFDRLAENEDRVRAAITQTVRQVGHRGVLYLNIPLPHLIFGLVNDQQLIFNLADYPEKLSAVFEKCAATALKLVEIGLDAGIRLFFCGTHSILGPNILKEHAVPYTVKLRERLHARHAFLYLHECGKMKAMIESGIYNTIRPDILEGFDRSPVGDIDDLRWAREQLDPRIIFKGNLRLEDLKNGNLEKIRELCRQTLVAVRGYSHILGTSCSVLYGTPLEHVRVLSEFKENTYEKNDPYGPQRTK